MRLAIVLGIVVLVLAAAFIGDQYYRHTHRVANLQQKIDFDTQYSQRFESLKGDLTPIIDAWNHAADGVFGNNAPASIADIVVLDEKAEHAQYEESRIDRFVGNLRNAIRDLHHDQHTPEKRETNGDLEQYWHSSDELRDALTGWRGFIKVGLSNPFADFGDAHETGYRLGHSLREYTHNFQVAIDLTEDTVDFLQSDLKDNKQRLAHENASWLLEQ